MRLLLLSSISLLLFLSLISCSDSSSNRTASRQNNATPNVEPDSTFNYEPVKEIAANTDLKNKHLLDLLPLLPQKAGKDKPLLNQVKIQKICFNDANLKNLKRVKYTVGLLGTDVATDFKIYYTANEDSYYIGDIQLEDDLKYMLVFSPGKSSPLFYVDYITSPQITNSTPSPNATATNSENEISAPIYGPLVLNHDSVSDINYNLQTLAKPRCGKKEGPEPTANYVDTEVTFYSATYQGELPRKDGATNLICINALQAIHSSFAHLQKKQSRPLKLTPIANKLNSIQGNIFRLACNKGSYLVPTSVEQNKIFYTGHSLYLAKLTLTVDKKSKDEDLYFNPKLKTSDSLLDFPTHNAIALAPYISEVSSSSDPNLKDVVAYIPVDHMIDCNQLYEQAGSVYSNNPQKRPLSTQIFEKFDVGSKNIKYELALSESDEVSRVDNDKCQGETPKTSPLIISFNPGKVVAVSDTPVLYDFDQDGKKEEILGWPKFDKNHVVGLVVHKMGKKFQLLGNATQLKNQKGFADGHEALAILDHNRDGVINKKDHVLDNYLFIWIDQNNDAVLDKKELHTFRQLQVKAIDVKNIIASPQAVSHTKLAYIDTANNIISNRRAKPAIIYDLWFTVSNTIDHKN